MIKATLFDIDGTLIDSNDLHVLAWEEAFAGIGEMFERFTIHDQIGKGADMLIPALLPNADDATRRRLDEAPWAHLQGQVPGASAAFRPCARSPATRA